MTRLVVAALIVESLVIGCLLIGVADQVAHTHVERLGGVNIWGYRGPVLHRKAANEIRVAVVGGDLAFGWGVAASEALAPSVREMVSNALADSPLRNRNVTAVTLGALGLAPSGYSAWIRHYAPLASDVVCIVVDPSRHRLARSPFVPARESALFRQFGYSPILPLVLQEKAAIRGSVVRRAAGDSLAYADELFRRRQPTDPWIDAASYLADIAAAVREGLRTAAYGVVVVTAPDAPPTSLDRQGVKAMVASVFSADPVRVVDLGEDSVMHSSALRLDGFNFSTAGHAAAARDVAPAVLELMRASTGTGR